MAPDDLADGAIKTTRWGLLPYGRYALTPRLGIWAAAGHGWGDVSVKPKRATGRHPHHHDHGRHGHGRYPPKRGQRRAQPLRHR